MAAQVGRFMAKTMVLMPTFKPYQLRNIIICAKSGKNIDANNSTPPVRSGDGPKHNMQVTGGGGGGGGGGGDGGGDDNIDKAKADDVNAKKS
ncbi:hypothetical protein CsSME_00016994 [Camellia sinensis var. sinensis]